MGGKPFELCSRCYRPLPLAVAFLKLIFCFQNDNNFGESDLYDACFIALNEIVLEKNLDSQIKECTKVVG